MTATDTPRAGREIRLAARPHGEPRQSDFELVQRPVREPADGEVLVRNSWMSVDPAMRGRMDDRPSYVPPFEIGKPLQGGAVGEVVASTVPELSPGDTVLHNRGWRDWAVGPAAEFRAVTVDGLSPSVYLGVLGMPGLTAYAGLVRSAELAEGDVVFVSGAAGAVGSLVGQLAKLRGHTVIGSAGSAQKIAWLRDELGFDHAFDYHDGPVRERLREAAPDGIDVYFDNVGGEQLEAAISALRLHGRVAVCGAISQYNATEVPAGPRNMAMLIGKRLTLRGLLVLDHFDLLPDFEEEVGGYLRSGQVHFRETVVQGLENAPQALIGQLRGDNTGKMVVRIS